VKIILLLKQVIREEIKVLFILITLMNCALIFIQHSTDFNIQDNSSIQFIDQAINILPESGCTKNNIKLLGESFADKCYSSQYSLKNPGNHIKSFIIISETISELNSRNSSFLISELTTST
jgi:hypothetical protein